jgi:putative transcriptional regulator
MRVKYIVIPRLGEILKEKNMTQMQLAELTGISQGAISRFDRNKQHLDVHLVAISRALNISIEDLFHIKEINE